MFAGTNRMVQYFVRAERERPDFRLVITYLWHDLYNVDTDGDSYNPASRTCTRLFVRNLQDESQVVYVNPQTNSPCVLRGDCYLPTRTSIIVRKNVTRESGNWSFYING